MNIKNTLILAITMLSLTGCFDGDSGVTNTLLSDVDIRCDVGNVNNCLTNGSFDSRDILIGLIFNNEQTCVNYLQTINDTSNFANFFDVVAFGQTATNSGNLGAVLNSPWVDVIGGPVSAVSASVSQMTVCGLIDLDNNGTISSGDAYYDSAYSITSGLLDLVLWDEF